MRQSWRRVRRLLLLPCLLLVVSLAYLAVVVRLHHEQQHQQTAATTSLLSNADDARVSAKTLNLQFRVSLVKKSNVTTTFQNTNGGTITRRVIRANRSPTRTTSLLQSSSSSHRPPLSSLIDMSGDGSHQRIIGDVQFLLDFAIVGFGKCGTSTLMHLLSKHSEIACFDYEIWELIHSRPAQLVQLLYRGLPESPYIQRAYKCPSEITEPHILEYYRTYWPRTKLIVGIRHPVWWFQSLYNFRIQNLLDDETLLHPNQLIGRCYKGMRLTCTEKANFAYYLLRLGKQNGPESRQEDAAAAADDSTRLVENIVGHFAKTWFNVSEVPFHPNPIFLYETSQLEDAEHESEFRHHLQKFLGLSTEIRGPIPSFKPGMVWANASVQTAKDALKIDICRDVYQPVRTELMRLAVQSSQWIRTEFLNFPTVTVSGRSRLDEILLGWNRDPCVRA